MYTCGISEQYWWYTTVLVHHGIGLKTVGFTCTCITHTCGRCGATGDRYGVTQSHHLCIYSLMNDILCPNNTIAFIVAWVCVPHSGDILLDVIHIVPCPSDPLLDSYDDAVPNFQFPMVYGLGIVLTPHKTLPNGFIAFSVTLTEYVHDTNQ